MQFFIHIMMLIANVCRFLGKDLYLLLLQAIESLADWLYLLVILNGIRRKMNENHLAIGKSSSFSSINVQLSIAICSIIRRFFSGVYLNQEPQECTTFAKNTRHKSAFCSSRIEGCLPEP